MDYYCARLFILCLVDSKKPSKKNICDYPFILYKAKNEKDAFKRALLLGKKQENKYKNHKGEWVRWVFVKVESIKHLGKNLDGVEVGSLLDVWKTEKPFRFRKRFSPEKSKPYYDFLI